MAEAILNAQAGVYKPDGFLLTLLRMVIVPESDKPGNSRLSRQ